MTLAAGSHVIGMSFPRQLAPDETVQVLRNNLDKVPLPIAPPVPLAMNVLVDGKRVGGLQVASYRLSDRYAQQNFPRDLQEIDVVGPYGAAAVAQTASRRWRHSSPGRSRVDPSARGTRRRRGSPGAFPAVRAR